MYNMENLDMIAQRFDAFWQGEILDCPMLAVTCPKPGAVWPPLPATLEQKWLDNGHRRDYFMQCCDNTLYFGDALPIHVPNFGPSVLANFVGGDYLLAADTVWYDRNPIVTDVDAPPPICFDESAPMWQALLRDYDAFYPYRDRCLVAFTDIGGTIDVAAALVGAEDLMMAMLEDEDAVLALCEKIDAAWLEAYRRSLPYLQRHQPFYSAWMPLLKRTPWYPLQADLSVMLSPAMFDTFVVPSLVRVARGIGAKCTYHLDGTGEIKHLESILAIPEIDSIEWVPDRFDGPWLDGVHADFFPMLRRVQESGRSLIMRMVNPQKIGHLFSEISPKGVFITTSVENEEQAQALLASLQQYR